MNETCLNETCIQKVHKIYFLKLTTWKAGIVKMTIICKNNYNIAVKYSHFHKLLWVLNILRALNIPGLNGKENPSNEWISMLLSECLGITWCFSLCFKSSLLSMAIDSYRDWQYSWPQISSMYLIILHIDASTYIRIKAPCRPYAAVFFKFKIFRRG